MNVVIPFHNGDANLAIDLVKWIGQLGGISEGQLYLICDSGTKPEHVEAITNASLYSGGFVSDAWKPVAGWPQGSNSLFAMALNGLEGRIKGPWLWLEPDAIPLKMGWLDAIRKEYTSCGKRYMGNVYVCNNPRLPNRLMSGIGVYPADALKEMIYFTRTSQAWDVEAARFLTSVCHPTKLIHHFWGIMGMAPTFASKRTDTSPPNTFTLKSIHKDAVIFHRNKDGTLLNLLKPIEQITQVLPGPEKPIKSQAELIAEIRKQVTGW